MEKVSNRGTHLTLHLIAVVLLLVVGPEIFAQNNDNLVGTWHLDINKSIEVMETPYKVQYDTLPPEIKNRAANRMNDREFIFLQTGDITVNWKSHKGPQVSIGRWMKDEGTKTISIIIENITSNYSYEFPSPEVLVMRPTNKRGFFDNLYLLKIN